MIHMPSWPRSACASVAALIAIFAFYAYWLHAETRTAYRAVGLNDGQIQQREQMMAMIRRTVPLADCNQLQATQPPVEVLVVKAESLYMSVGNGGGVRFCQ
jgi:hypothetical protein